MSDPVRALPELDRRLRERITTQGGMLVLVEGWMNGVQVIPMPVSWKLRCSFEGIDVVFTTGRGEEDRIKVGLTDAALSDEQCKLLAPEIGAKMIAILQHR
jgi:hypothetical protein